MIQKVLFKLFLSLDLFWSDEEDPYSNFILPERQPAHISQYDSQDVSQSL